MAIYKMFVLSAITESPVKWICVWNFFFIFFNRTTSTVKAGRRRPKPARRRRASRHDWRRSSTSWSPGAETRVRWGPRTGPRRPDGPRIIPPPTLRSGNGTDSLSSPVRLRARRRPCSTCVTPTAAASTRRSPDRRGRSGTWCRWG